MQSLLMSLTLLLGVHTCFSQGFRDLEWGTEFETIKASLIPSENKLLGHSTYDRKSEDFGFEGIEAHSITYAFKKNQLRVVTIGIYGVDFKRVCYSFQRKYGDPEITENSMFINFKWNLEDTELSVTMVLGSRDSKNATVSLKSMLE